MKGDQRTMAELKRAAKADILQMCSAHAENVYDPTFDDRQAEAWERAAEEVANELYRRSARLRGDPS